MEISKFIHFYHMSIVNGFIVDVVAVAVASVAIAIFGLIFDITYHRTNQQNEWGEKRTTGKMDSNERI